MAPNAVAVMALPELVCVTGASGHLGTWLVKRLLERGYRVRATVRNPGDPTKTAILRNLPGADERLQIVRGQLLEESGFDDAVNGCDGVFHCACPTEFSFEDPYKDCIEPAVNGTVNVLKACAKAPSIKRIVFTSSAAAVRFTQLEDIAGQRFDENCWTDIEMCERDKPHGWPYFVSKTLSEKKAFELAQEYNLDLVTILPPLVNGPFLIDKIPNSVADAISLVTGDISHHKFIRRISYVHIDDIIDAHIFLYETPAAQGRYNGSCADASITEIAELLKKLFPKIKLPDNFDYVGEILLHYMDNSKLKKLGFEFKHGLADMFESAVKCCVEKGLLQYPGEAP
uniref:Dihydroflavonol 4-reductase n=1 Tax=Dryopteris erythrosora TaxID=239562 RepID=A0A5P8I1W3_9MONI|nr:dihydroflavonol 4-reductase [Dryopteris erythrosora]